ncbi:hypothetical protein SAMN04487968_109199 [Nocardioides terrae]|uniref:Tetratricopeptide repeat-containing protein n=1 Tax=Nocardioides terrae TaxID=574651 RepID=A0A1I1L895_9ACTN|nr:tetratricopeptide repeat protein [Nocardioides terrae]SFC69317.1 hypothetical protein SAMN04487968_109199 [Nocardioides terrae]
MAEERRSSRPTKGDGAGRTGAPGRSGSDRGGKPAGQGRAGGRGASASSGKSGAGRPSGKDGAPSRRSDRPAGERKGSDRAGYDRQGSDRPGSDRKSGDRPGSDRKSSDRKGSDRAGYDRKSSDRPGSDRRSGTGRPGAGRDGAKGPQRSDRPRRDRADRSEAPARTADQKAYDGPELPEWVTGKELDRSIVAQLKGLPEKLAARVARHLAAAGSLIDSDPELAYQHAKAAKSRAQRLAVVREALGEAAYAAGHYAEALAELRAAKRMNGATAYLPIMADCHRALGQPEQAIKLAQSPSVANFVAEAKAEMTIVEAGARRDMGQFDAALRVLEQAPLMSKSRSSWVVRLRYAYADTLEAAGRPTDALMWFHRTFAIDSDELTDAAERAAALEVGRD